MNPRSFRLTVRPAEPGRDASSLQSWLTHPASRYWDMAGVTVEQTRDYLARICSGQAEDAWLILHDDQPVAYAETYDPAQVVLTGVYDADPGDLGMHLLVAPAPNDPQRRLHGLTDAIMDTVLEHCFRELGAQRIAVEPDESNVAIRRKNAAAGFRHRRVVDLPDKRGALATLDRADFRRPAPELAPDLDAAHLSPDAMGAAQRHLVAKALAEFAHEHLIEPEADPQTPGRWHLRTPTGIDYVFDAEVVTMHHWLVDEPSLRRLDAAGHQLPLDAQELVVEWSGRLGVPEELLGTYLEELASTLASAAFKTYQGGPSARQLAQGRTDVDVATDFQQVEAAMTEGHPGFVATNGRIGFGLRDFRVYAPEAAGRFRYVWLAARTECAHLETGEGITQRLLTEQELDPRTRERFLGVLHALGLDPADYLWLPVHPWQFQHRIAIGFAADLADRRLVVLGEGDHEYQPQQSIRTAFNRTRPDLSYVKTALSIQNMGFLRGLSPDYMRATPAINDWVAGVVRGDEVLREANFDVLREYASVGYTGDAYHRSDLKSDQQKMLAALWRESPVPLAAPGERLVTMAALLHRDQRGHSVAKALVDRSGLAAPDWLAESLRHYLVPVLHCLEVHELAFMPHGENLILRVREGRVRGAFMKDIGEEAAILGDRELPEEVSRMRHPIDDAEIAQLIFTDVFDGVLRHLSGILHVDGVLAVDRFWDVVGRTIREYQSRSLPRRRRLDLFPPEFEHSCLNRLQLRNTRQMVDLSDPSGSLIYSGRLRNPIAS